MDAGPVSPTKVKISLPPVKDAAIAPRSRPSVDGKRYSYIEGDVPTVKKQLKNLPSTSGKYVGQDPSTILVSPCPSFSRPFCCLSMLQ
jgi:hypothetical protein